MKNLLTLTAVSLLIYGGNAAAQFDGEAEKKQIQAITDQLERWAQQAVPLSSPLSSLCEAEGIERKLKQEQASARLSYSQDEDERIGGAAFLGLCGDDEYALISLRVALESKTASVDVRRSAASSLGLVASRIRRKTGREEWHSISAFQHGLEDADAQVREFSANGLMLTVDRVTHWSYTKVIISRLQKLSFQDPEPDVREAARRAWENIYIKINSLEPEEKDSGTN
ncbi:MAG: hypothetical protein HY402_03980 [Elusimicrobia bacterium]|nr:hypothetical protein [Elusimicrobiota bacterium]